MGKFVSKLREILKADIIICGSTNDHIHLEEEKNSAGTASNVLQKVTIKDFKNKNRIFIKADKGTEFTPNKNGKKTNCLSPLLKNDGSCPHNRVCDGIIVEENNGDAKILLIELKSTDTTGAATQIKNTKCFVEYLACIAKDFYGLPLKPEFRGIIFHTETPMKIKKRATRPLMPAKPNANWDSPAKRVVNNKQEISVKELLW